MPDAQGFSVESLIDEANKAWDEPDDTPSGTELSDGGSPDAASAESPAPGSTPEPNVLTDRGDGRDPKGRFVSKETGQQDPARPEDDPAKAAPSPAPSLPTPEAAKAPLENPPGPEGGPAQPYSVRFGGRDFDVPGAVRTATHTVIPNDQEPVVSRYIGMGLKYETERDQIKRDKAQTAIEREMFTAETGPVMEAVKELFAIAGLQDEEQFATEFTKYAWELRNSLPILRERMELSRQRQELAVRERVNAPDPETVAQQLFQGAVETVRGHIGQWQHDPTAKALHQEDWQWVEGRVQRDPAYFLQRAGQRLTQEEQQAGVSPGEVYFNQQKLVDLVNDRLEWRTELEHRDQEARRAVEVAKQNAVRQAGSVPPPPPAGGADVSTSERDDSPKKYSSMAELKKDLGVSW